ncbi:MAG: hypothetical protein C5B53_09635 [Candidatus Melainabacteria bacterium]|nr:MAG: hypothetical protein C5B53_09635 [Candidatus Melainabacteria bacterium]
MNNANVSRVFSTTLNNLKRLFKPDQQLEAKPEPEPEQVHVAARIANPWQDELDRLVANRFQPKEFSEPINEQLSNLTQMAQEVQQKVARKAKRSGDGTVTDLKAWWGESVATWDPEIGSADTMEQKSKTRTLKRWFT